MCVMGNGEKPKIPQETSEPDEQAGNWQRLLQATSAFDRMQRMSDEEWSDKFKNSRQEQLRLLKRDIDGLQRKLGIVRNRKLKK